ncbi:MAG: hypothetical protein ACREPQ_14270 [Rhodanobacter sp.]
MTTNQNLSQRQVAAVLAGLRLLQELRRVGGMPAPIRAILTNNGKLTAMNDEEIDALSESLNV